MSKIKNVPPCTGKVPALAGVIFLRTSEPAEGKDRHDHK